MKIPTQKKGEETTQYQAPDGRVFFVAHGIGKPPLWGTFYRKHWPSPRKKRLKSPAVPMREDRSQAEADLERYAAKHGWQKLPVVLVKK